MVSPSENGLTARPEAPCSSFTPVGPGSRKTRQLGRGPPPITNRVVAVMTSVHAKLPVLRDLTRARPTPPRSFVVRPGVDGEAHRSRGSEVSGQRRSRSGRTREWSDDGVDRHPSVLGSQGALFRRRDKGHGSRGGESSPVSRPDPLETIGVSGRLGSFHSQGTKGWARNQRGTWVGGDTSR